MPKSSISADVKRALAYGKTLVGVPYDPWKSGQDTRAKEAPFYAQNAPPPAAVKTCICAGLANLMRRKLGLPVFGDGKYAGGTWAWFNALKKKRALKPFDPRKSYPAGTLLLRNYKNVADQGHVAVIAEKNRKGVLFSKLLHCYRGRGVALDGAVGSSHFWHPEGYYTHICLPEDWLA